MVLLSFNAAMANGPCTHVLDCFHVFVPKQVRAAPTANNNSLGKRLENLSSTFNVAFTRLRKLFNRKGSPNLTPKHISAVGVDVPKQGPEPGTVADCYMMKSATCSKIPILHTAISSLINLSMPLIMANSAMN